MLVNCPILVVGITLGGGAYLRKSSVKVGGFIGLCEFSESSVRWEVLAAVPALSGGFFALRAAS